MLKKHIILTAIGLGLAALALSWMQLETSSGATFLTLFILIAVNAVGSLFGHRRSNAGDASEERE